MNIDNLDKLEKLSVLKERGVLTDEEFNSKKRILLESLDSCSRLTNQKNENGTYWLPVPSMILGILVILECFDGGGRWNVFAIIEESILIIISLTLGIMSISIQEKGKGMAIAGITLSLLSSFIIIGLMNNR